MTHTTKTPARLRAEIAEREAALAAMEAYIYADDMLAARKALPEDFMNGGGK
jgi:hypothetical protein